MSYICLILSGAALLINGLGLLGRIPAARGKASPSAFIGWAALLTGPATTTVPALLGLSGAWPAGWLPAGIAAVLIAGLYVAALAISKTGRPQTPSNQGSGSARVAGPVSA